MPAPAAIFLAPAAGGVAVVSKRKQAGTVTDNAPTGVSTGDVAENVANGDNLASATKKPTNWLLIGALAVGAIVVFRMFKK